MPFGMSSIGSLGSVGNIVGFVTLEGTEAFNNKLDQLNGKVAANARMLDQTMKAAILAGATAFATAVIEAAKFEKQMAMVNTLLDSSDSSFGRLNDEVLKLAQGSNASIPSLTKGLYDLISSGATSSNAMDALTLAVRAAGAGMTTTDVAIRAGMATVNAYGLSMDQLNRIYDLQFQAVNKGVLTYEELGNSIGTVLPSAANLGVSLEDVYGALAHITKGGIDAQSATTYLSQAFNSMIENSGKWEALGVAIYDVEGKFRGLGPVIGDLSGKLSGLSTEQKQAVLETLDMDIRAGRAILSMTNNYSGFVQTMGDVANSSGAMNDAFLKATDTFAYQSGVLKNQLQVAFIEMGNNILPILKAMTTAFTEHPEAIKAIVSTVGELAIGLGSLAALYKTIQGLQVLWATSFGPIGIAITALGVGYIAMKAAVEGLEAASNSYITSIPDNIFKLQELESRYNSLMATENLSQEQQDILKKTVDELKIVYGNLGVKILETDTNFGKLTESIKAQKIEDLKLQVMQLHSQLDTMNEKIEKAGMNATSFGGNIATVSMATGVWVDEKKRLNTELTLAEEAIRKLSASTAESTTNTGSASDADNRHVGILRDLTAINLALSGSVRDSAIRQAEHTLEITKEIPYLENTIELTDEQKEALRRLEAATGDSNNKWTEYSQLIHEVTGRMGPVGNAINVIVDSLVSGGDPLVTALNLAVMAFGFLDSNEKTVIYTTEEVIDRIYGASSAMAELYDNIDNVNSELEGYAIVDEATKRFNALTQQLTDAYNRYGSLSVQVKLLTDQLGIAADQVEAFSNAFDFMDQKLSEQSSYLTGEIIDAWKYYGGAIPIDKLGTWYQLLNDNLAQLNTIKGTLAEGSQAWLDNEAAINANNYIMGLLAGSWNDFSGYLSQANLDIEATSRFLTQMGVSAEDLPELLKSLGFEAYNTGTAFGNANNAVEDFALTTNTLTSQTAEINAELAKWEQSLSDIKGEQDALNAQLEEATRILNEQVGALQSDIAEWQKQIDAIDNELNWNIDLTPPTLEEIGTAMQGVKDKIAAAQSELAGIEIKITGLEAEKQQAIENYINSINILISKAGELKIAWGDSLDTTMSNFDTLFGSGTNSWVNKALAAISQLQFFNIDLDTTKADESIAGTIAKMQEYLSTLDPSSSAYQAAVQALNGLIDKYRGLTGEGSLADAIQKQKDLLSTLDPNSIDYQKAQAGLANLQSKYDTLYSTFDSEVGVNFNNQQAIDGINAIGTSYDEQVAELEANAAMVTMNLSDYRATLIYMGWKYQEKVDELNAMKANLQVNISTAQSQIGTLQSNYNSMKAAIEAQITNLNVSAAQANIVIANLRASLNSLVNTGWTVPVTVSTNGTIARHDGGLVYHDGGWVTAHDGYNFNTKGYEATPFIGLKGEYVNRNAFVEKYGAINMDLANRTLDASYLTKNTQQSGPTSVTVTPNIEVHGMAPNGWVEVTDKYVHPRIKKNELYTVKSTKFNA